MALQVWLPLNKEGDLKNRGLANITVTNTGATYDANGKIGGCYNFNGSNSYISMTSQSINDCFKGGNISFSISFWVFHADNSRAVIFGDYLLSKAININLELSTSHDVRFYWGGNPDYRFSGPILANVWQHIVITYDGSLLKYYLNGVLKDTRSYTLSTKNKTDGEWRLGRDSREGTIVLNGKLNDFRIYDHCLSPKEIEEISKGLVLHYPMNLEGLKLVWWNLLITNGDFNSLDNWIKRDTDTAEIINKELHIITNRNWGAIVRQLVDIKVGHKYYVKTTMKVIGDTRIYIGFSKQLTMGNNSLFYTKNTDYVTMDTVKTISLVNDANPDSILICAYDTTSTGPLEAYVKYLYAVDLTAMFGEGKEPTAEQFRKMYPCDYYPYCAGEWRLANKGQWVNFNQLIPEEGKYANGVDYIEEIEVGTIYYHYNNSGRAILRSKDLSNYQGSIGNKYYIHADVYNCLDISNTLGCWLFGDSVVKQSIDPKSWKTFSIFGTSNGGSAKRSAFGQASFIANSVNGDFIIKNWFMIALTQMFGEGNEPTTVEEFKALYPNEYYEYVESRYEDTGGYYEDGQVVEHIPDTAFEDFSMYGNKMFDTSGYSNNGTITGSPTVISEGPRYTKSLQLNSGRITLPVPIPNAPVFTISFWMQSLDWTPETSNFQVVLVGNWFIYRDHNATASYTTSIPKALSGTSYCALAIPDSAKTKWMHISIIHQPTLVEVYINGNKTAQNVVETKPLGTGNLIIGPGYTDTKLNDFRIYTTALTPEQVKELYNTSAIITNNHSLLGYEFDESAPSDNILSEAQEALLKKLWQNGISNDAQQTYCKCTLTDDGERIYRNPNRQGTVGSSGTDPTMNWGGFVLNNKNNRFGLLIGHTYLIKVDVKGISDTAMTDCEWKHQVGWNFTLSNVHPLPTNVQIINPITSTFNSSEWVQLSYKWTISDSIYKIATLTINNHTQGTEYLSYYLFKLGWTYTKTGEIGTDVYFNNLRMYDITNSNSQLDITDKGCIDAFDYTESDTVFFDYHKGITANELIEY